MTFKKPLFKRPVPVIILLVSLALVAGCGGKSQPKDGSSDQVVETKTIRLTIGSANAPEGAPWTKYMDEFFTVEVNKRLKERTNYQIDWNKAYGGAVAKVGEELQAIQQGLVDIGMVVYPYEASRLPLHNFTYWVPFGPPDPVMLAEVGRQIFDEFPYLTEVFEKDYNQKYLGFAVIQDYNLVTTFPVDSVDDLKGRKIAAVGPNLHFLKGTGAVPVQSSIPEMYTSFQTGVYEGWVMLTDSVYNMKIYEVAPYYARGVDFGAIILSSINVNLDRWNQLPKEVQEVFQEVAQEYIDLVAVKAKESFTQNIARWKEKGGTVNDFPSEERIKWANMLPNTPNERAKELDAKGLPASKLMRRYFEIPESKGYTPPRTYEIE